MVSEQWNAQFIASDPTPYHSFKSLTPRDLILPRREELELRLLREPPEHSLRSTTESKSSTHCPLSDLVCACFRLTNDFHVNKRIIDDVAEIQTKRLRNKIAGYTTHLMKRIAKGPVRGISLRLQEEVSSTPIL